MSSQCRFGNIFFWWGNTKKQSYFFLCASYSSTPMCSGAVKAVFSCFFQLTAAFAGFKHSVTPYSSPTAPYVHHEPYTSHPKRYLCIYCMKHKLFLWRHVLHVRTACACNLMSPKKCTHKQCMSSHPVVSVSPVSRAAAVLCLLPTLITLSNHCKVKDTSVSLCSSAVTMVLWLHL